MKVLKGIGLGLLVIITIFMIGNIANSQTKARAWLCDLFLCQNFVDLEAKVDEINARTIYIQQLIESSDNSALMQKVDLLLKPESSIWIEALQPSGNIQPIAIYMKGESLLEYQAFGLDLVFDPAIFSYSSIEKGSMIQEFSLFDANEVQAGTIRIGWVAGTATGIIGTSAGTIAILNMQRINPTPSEVTLQNYVDNISDLKPNPYSKTIQ